MAWNALLEAFQMTFTLPVLGGVLLGLALGLIFGAIPGLTTVLGIVLLLPFVWTMSPFVAFAIMLSLVSAVHTSNTFPAFFFNVPGSPSAAATILDGYPMARNGDAARGLTAAFVVSGVGGVIGAIALLVALPLLQPVVLAFAAPERFMLVVLGIAMISFLSGSKPVKGLIAAAFGFWLGTIGQDPQEGVPRFTLGEDYLLEGLNTVPIVMGMFALPEVVAMAMRGRIAEKTHVDMGSGFWPGVRACIDNRWLVVRSALIGVAGGAIPGIGGTAAAFYAYGTAVQSAPEEEREKFGKGDIRGVIAPESANNASAGGELVPLLAFGVPGGATTAVLLAAFLILGVNPGPSMLGAKLSLSFSMVLVLVLSNLLATAFCILVTKRAARIAFLKSNYLIPILLLFILFGSYVAYPHPYSLVLTVAFGALGFAMMRFGWARPPLLVSFILGPLAENNLSISLSSYGAGFMLRPIPLALMAIIALVLYLKYFRRGARG
jgi:putative tricarboxylic transport membrane protein